MLRRRKKKQFEEEEEEEEGECRKNTELLEKKQDFLQV